MSEPQHLYELTLLTGETLEIWRLPHGGIVGIDSTFLEQVEDTISDPYNPGKTFRLLEPGKEDKSPELACVWLGHDLERKLPHGLEEHLRCYLQLQCMHGEPACFRCIEEALANEEERHEAGRPK